MANKNTQRKNRAQRKRIARAKTKIQKHNAQRKS